MIHWVLEDFLFSFRIVFVVFVLVNSVLCARRSDTLDKLRIKKKFISSFSKFDNRFSAAIAGRNRFWNVNTQPETGRIGLSFGRDRKRKDY